MKQLTSGLVDRSASPLALWVGFLRTSALALALGLCLSLAYRSGLAEDGLQPQFGIQPSMFMLDIGDKPVNESITVVSMKKRPVSMRVELYAWTIDEHGNFKLIPSSPKTLDQWMVVNPLRFTISPSGKQIIRFSIRPRVKPEPGEYRAILYLVEEPGPSAGKESVAQFVGKFGIGVYGFVPPIVHAPKLLDLSYIPADNAISMRLLNAGNVHARFRGRYVAWEKNSFPGFESLRNLPDEFEPGKEPRGYLGSGSFPGDPVLAGTQRRYKLKVQVPQNSGPYVVAVLGELDEKPIEKLFK